MPPSPLLLLLLLLFQSSSSLRCLLDLDLHRKYIIYITNINHLLHIKHVWLNSMRCALSLVRFVRSFAYSECTMYTSTSFVYYFVQCALTLMPSFSSVSGYIICVDIVLWLGYVNDILLIKLKSLRSKFCLNSNLYELINKFQFQFQVGNFLASTFTHTHSSTSTHTHTYIYITIIHRAVRAEKEPCMYDWDRV